MPVLLAVSASRVSKSDKAMDESGSWNGQSSAAGISIRNGPVNGDPMDVDQSNGIAKRKARTSIARNVSYKDDSDSDDAAPLVCWSRS